MPVYHYQGLNSSGQEVSGTVEADTERKARQTVSEARGVMVVHIREIAPDHPDAQDLAPDNSAAGKPNSTDGDNTDWRAIFQFAVRQRRFRHNLITGMGLIPALGIFLWLLYFGDGPVSWVYAFAILGIAILFYELLRPCPWPDCPACGVDFSELGSYCPECGGPLAGDSRPRQAFCSHCDRLISIVAKTPSHKLHRQGALGMKSGEYRLFVIPIHYCTHCRAKLGDG